MLDSNKCHMFHYLKFFQIFIIKILNVFFFKLHTFNKLIDQD